MRDPLRTLAQVPILAVLHALRDRLTVEEAADLGAQLPTLVRGVYYEGYHPAGKPDRYRDLDEFLQRVSTELQAAGGANSEAASRAVMTVLDEHLSEGEARHVREMLPKGLRTLWPEHAA